jgi:hypothetical protein
METHLVLIVIYLLFLHFVGDFIFQTSWMATNKGKKITALLVHILAYSLVLAAGSALFLTKSSWDLWATYVGVNAALHLFTDAITSQFTRRYKEAGDDKAFFAAIGFDQFIHGASLIGTFYLVFLWK